MVGGFVGQVYDASFSDIVLENFGTISSIIDNERSDGATWSFVGGFAGRNWDKNSFSNIVLNNIGAIRSKFSSDDVGEVIGVYSGGFIGSIESGGGIFSNIILSVYIFLVNFDIPKNMLSVIKHVFGWVKVNYKLY